MHSPSQNVEHHFRVHLIADPEAINVFYMCYRCVRGNKGHRYERSVRTLRTGLLALLPGTIKLPLDLGCHLQQVPSEKGLHTSPPCSSADSVLSLSATKCSPLLLCPYHFRSALMGWVFDGFCDVRIVVTDGRIDRISPSQKLC